MRAIRNVAVPALFLASLFAETSLPAQSIVQGPSSKLADRAAVSLPEHNGSIVVPGLEKTVQVLRDTWGIPHIYAENTHDLFFAQGFVAAQDHMWQMELWRRSGEGRLAEVLGPTYVERDKFARTLTFHGNWAVEFRKYHPDGELIFSAFAEGVNAAIKRAIEEQKVPLEFQLMGFQPEATWTARSVVTRLPAWNLSRNASSELARALAMKAIGAAKAAELDVTDPVKKLEIPAGLELDDVVAQILDLSKGAGSVSWHFTPNTKPAGASPAAGFVAAPSSDTLSASAQNELFSADSNFDLGSNNWVIGGKKSATGMPLLANDPHREVVNPALRMMVHLVAPGWDVEGMTEPGLPGISVGHNENVAWGFTILGVDQEDLYVEETDPQHPDRYRYKGEWKPMESDRELIHVKGDLYRPIVFDVKRTMHGPVVYEDKERHRAYALRWVGAESGGAGYLGSLNVLQTHNWDEFNRGVQKSWYLPSHSLVYADTTGNYGYVAAALSPLRPNWDGLMPVPGKDGTYEWNGFVPLGDLPRELNNPRGFYDSANNNIVPKYFPHYKTDLGFEYSSPYRYDRITEVLSQNKKFTIKDMEALQSDHVSLPARALLPILKGLHSDKPGVQAALDKLRGWDMFLEKDSVPATIYEYWLMELQPLVYGVHLPDAQKANYHQYDVRRVVEWMTKPDKEFGPKPTEVRNALALTALEQAVTFLNRHYGTDTSTWTWGSIHKATFEHPLLATSTADVLAMPTVSRGGDAYTVQATSNPTPAGATEQHGASAMFVLDVQNWDRSVALNTPGNESQMGSKHSADLAPMWGDGKYFPLAYSRTKVEQVTQDRLTLQPELDNDKEDEAPFKRVQAETFAQPSPIVIVWGDYDNDGWPDMFVGYNGGMSKLFHNNHGTFEDVSFAAGITDAEGVRAAAFGDFDGDGNLDLYVGYGYASSAPNRLYKGDGHGHFIDVAQQYGLNDWGESRQVAFVDYNNDGRPDLFLGFREKENKLYRNDGDHFTDVTKQMGITGANSTVGVVWFDYNEDGKLDMFEANQNGKANVVYRNDGDHFTDVTKELGLGGGQRSAELGSVSIAVSDFNNDGRLDLFYANYGPSWLMRNDGNGKFTDVAPQMGIEVGRHLVSAGWGDYDNDGKEDLYTDGYLVPHPNIRDYLFHNDGDHFTDVTSGYMMKHDGDHAVTWVDYDNDGAMDLALADHDANTPLLLYHNTISADQAAHSLQVLVLDANGHYTKAGSEVRLYKAGTRQVISARLTDTGSGYDGQSVLPVHFGLPTPDHVDVEVTTMSNSGRKITRVENVDPWSLKGKPLVVRTAP